MNCPLLLSYTNLRAALDTLNFRSKDGAMGVTLKMAPIGIGFVAGLLTFLIVWVAMLLFGFVVDFLWPVQYSSSDLAHNLYAVLRWTIPALGGLVTFIFMVMAERFSSSEVFQDRDRRAGRAIKNATRSGL